jgi:hypothetical protein
MSGSTIVPVGSFALDATGTHLPAKINRAYPAGSVQRFYVRILTGPNSNNSSTSSPLTAITVR